MARKRRLTKSDKMIYDFIRKFTEEHEYSPTYMQICDGTGLKSKASVFYHLGLLRDFGYIKQDNGESRTIVLLRDLTDADIIVKAQKEETVENKEEK